MTGFGILNGEEVAVFTGSIMMRDGRAVTRKMIADQIGCEPTNKRDFQRFILESPRSTFFKKAH